MNDSELLSRFARQGDHAAFAELVRRHADLVYATALRASRGEAHMARDVTQRVFIALARKAGKLAPHPALLGWLHRAAWLDANETLRREARRRLREAASGIGADNVVDSEHEARDWAELAPLLDEALGELSEKDREAILARHVAGLSFAEVGERLGVAENAARMRTERALEKLRGVLARRGLTSTAVALGGCLTAHARVAAPAELVGAATRAGIDAATVAGAAAAGATGVGGLGAGLAALWASRGRLGPALATGAAVLGLALGGVLLVSQANDAGDGRRDAARAASAGVGEKAAERVVASEKRAPSRFANLAEYQAWLRRVFEAESADAAFAALRDGGVRVSRAAFDKAYPDMMSRRRREVALFGELDNALYPAIQAWIEEDVNGATGWVLAHPLRSVQSMWLWPVTSYAFDHPEVFPGLLEAFKGHALWPELKAWAIRAESGPRSAVMYMTGPEYGAIGREYRRGSYGFARAVAAWLREEPNAALAWVAQPRQRDVRDGVLQGLAEGLGSVNHDAALDAVLKVMAPLKGAELEASLHYYLSLARQVAPEHGATLALRVFGAEASNDELRWSLSNWAYREDPAGALRFIEEHRLPGALLAGVAEGWAHKDPQAARAWLDSLPGEARAEALPGFLGGWGAWAPNEALAMATGLPEGKCDEGIANVLKTLMSTDAPAAIAWLEERPAGVERNRLVRDAAEAVAVTAPEVALNTLARFAVMPDEKLAFKLANVLSREASAEARRFVEALPDGSPERVAAASALVPPAARTDYDAARAEAKRWVGPAEVDAVLFNLMEWSDERTSMAADYPGLATRVWAEVDVARLDPKRRQDAGKNAITVMNMSWSDDELVTWAATIKDREIAAGAREALEAMVPNPTAEQRAVIERLGR